MGEQDDLLGVRMEKKNNKIVVDRASHFGDREKLGIKEISRNPQR